MNTLETLEAARKLIEDERDWYRAPLSDCNGKRRVNKRIQRCAGAAVCDAGAPWPNEKDTWEALETSMGGDVPRFNATHTHAEVLTAFDEAIARLSDACKQVTR